MAVMECLFMKNEHLELPVIAQQTVIAMKTVYALVQVKKDLACVDQTVIVVNNHFLFIFFTDNLI
jgi:hypothetical protein